MTGEFHSKQIICNYFFFLIFVYFLVLSLFFVSFASVGFTGECLGFSASVLFGVLSIIRHGST